MKNVIEDEKKAKKTKMESKEKIWKKANNP
jgi:hypothetical protein